MEQEKEVSPQDLASAKKTDTIITKCPNCGGNMIYDPDSRGLKCEYCGFVQEVDFSHYSEEIDLDKLFHNDSNEWGKETHVFRCNNCGATEILAKTEISKKCSFCGTSNVVETNDVSGLKPNAVLPFLIDKSKACEFVVTWAKKKWLAPKAFKKSIEPGETNGNFYPAFTFDSDTFSNYHGVLGKYYYETVKLSNGKTEKRRKIRWFTVRGSQPVRFDDLLVQAMTDEKAKYVRKLTPYDTNHSQEYETNFLQGYSATQYSKDGKQCWSEAQATMKNIIRKEILSRYDYDVVQSLNVNTSYANNTYKYILLPVYIGHFEFNKKNYNYFVNGQNGKVAGKTPVSPIKVSILVAIGLLIVVGIILLYIFCGGE